ncbi:hypothetical protein [Microbulbifer discodermiae]|uniref:hypothetical protein n=1 Tax=Microbulbifer sp. 2201CG32-9 TaxID=3232309 RepID=UPI00345C0EC6
MTDILPPLPLWLWFLLALLGLFVARKPVQRAFMALARFCHQSLRLAAVSVADGERRLRRRNREVLLAAGCEAAERCVERELDHVEKTVKRELARYPELHRRLSEQLTAIDRDYALSVEVPPEPGNWSKAIRAVAEIPASRDPVVCDVLEAIRNSMHKAEARALEVYRESARERHQLLRRMMPAWRSILSALSGVNRNVETVIRRAGDLDRHMDRLEEIQRGGDRASRRLAASATTRFFASLVALSIAAAAAVVHFHLIALPVAGAGGSAAHIAGFRAVEVFALVVILLEIFAGLVAMECLRITQFFPAVGALDDKPRRRMLWIAFTALLVLAAVTVSLIWTRELVPGEGGAAADMNRSAYWLYTAAQMGLGLVLPFALAAVAMPLETFITSARTVVGILSSLLLRMLSLGLRLCGTGALVAGGVLVRLYDIVIFLPLWLERRFLDWRAGKGRPPGEPEPS